MKYHLIKARKKDGSRHRVWFEQGSIDLKASTHSHAGGYFEWSCYQATQAVEKALKSVIMHAGWKHPKTHKLSVLIGLCNNLNQSFRKARFEFRDLEIYTFISRYPFLIPGEKSAPHYLIKKEDSDKCIKQGAHLLDITSGILNLPYDDRHIEYEEIKERDIENRLEKIKNSIIKEMTPEKIILFGGYAEGKKKLSTFNILIIAETNRNFVDRVRHVREITKGGLPVVHPLVYTPNEFKEYVDEGHSFLDKVVKKGRVIYEKKNL